MPQSTVTSKGQITLPKEVREFLHAETGTKLEFIIQENDVMVKTVDRSIRDLRGLLHKPGRKPVPLDRMDRAVKAAAAKRL
jgi:AbrB family looped-hinge helix DNA binding protein